MPFIPFRAALNLRVIILGFSSSTDAERIMESPSFIFRVKEPGTKRSSLQSNPRRASSEYVIPLYQYGDDLNVKPELLNCRFRSGNPWYMLNETPFRISS